MSPYVKQTKSMFGILTAECVMEGAIYHKTVSGKIDCHSQSDLFHALIALLPPNWKNFWVSFFYAGNDAP